MPRASDYLVEGYTYHLTHRCQNGEFHLRFAGERRAYRKWLFEGVRRHNVPVYAYCVTCNHVHVVVRADDVEAVGRLMQLAAGSTAKPYNLRKGHLGSVWEHPYHCTMVENGRHLFNCLCYVDLNMVRAGVVEHPEQWRWCGYDELAGLRTRYRILDLEGLLESVGIRDPGEFRDLYRETVRRRIAERSLGREAHWTESVALGSREFVERVQSVHRRRMGFDAREVPVPGPGPQTWAIRESREPYTADSDPKSSL